MENEDNSIKNRKNNIKSFFTFWIKNNYDKTFIFIIIIALIIRIWIFTKTYNQPIWWDAGDYLSTAKNWGLQLKMRDIWYYRRGFLWPLFSAFFFLIGIGEIGIRFSEVLFSIGIIFVSYFLIKEMFNKKYALATIILLTFSWNLLFFTARPLTNIPATFLLLISVLFFWKSYFKRQGNKFLYLFAIFFALTILTRMQYLMFTPAFLVLIFTREKFKFLKNKQLWISLLIFTLILSPHIFLYSQHYGNPLTDIMSHYFGIGGVSETTTIERQSSKTFDYIKNLPYILDGTWKNPSVKPIFYFFIIGVFFFFSDLLLGFDKIFKNSKLQKRLFILTWILVPLLVLGYITDYVEQRYVIPQLTFLFLISSISIFKLSKLLYKNPKTISRIILVIFVITIISIPNLIFANQLINAKKSSYLEIKQAGEWLKQQTPLDSKIITQSRPQITYYSERETYNFAEAGLNESAFKEFIKENKPNYLLLSAYESHDQWMYNYPNNASNNLMPLVAFPSVNQPKVIIYQFKYDPINQNILEKLNLTER